MTKQTLPASEAEMIARIEQQLDPAFYIVIAEAQAAHEQAQTRVEQARQQLAAHLATDVSADPFTWAATCRQLEDVVPVLEQRASRPAAELAAAQRALSDARRRVIVGLRSELNNSIAQLNASAFQQIDELQKKIQALEEQRTPEYQSLFAASNALSIAERHFNLN